MKAKFSFDPHVPFVHGAVHGQHGEVTIDVSPAVADQIRDNLNLMVNIPGRKSRLTMTVELLEDDGTPVATAAGSLR